MTYTIWKFPVPIEDEFTLEIPGLVQVLSVQAQDDEPCLWAIVETSAKPEAHGFSLRGTGHAVQVWLIGKPDVFVGTFQLPNLGLVYHLFYTGAVLEEAR